MYFAHFGLKEVPFSITPDTDFYFAAKRYQDVLNTLLIAIGAGEGFLKVTGEVGTGKTMLCRKLINSLGPKYKVAYIPNPYLEPRTLLFMLATELGIAVSAADSQHELLASLNLGLMEFAREQMQVVVCLDEVQAMPIETLEALRLLSNLETEKRKLLQVVLFGQPELEDKLNHPSIRQLRQRISYECHLGRMSRHEMDAYLAHRLAVAGHQGRPLFNAASVKMMYEKSGGIPRLINVLAGKSMMLAYGKGLSRVSASEMRVAIEDTQVSGQVPKSFGLLGLAKVGFMLLLASFAMMLPA